VICEGYTNVAHIEDSVKRVFNSTLGLAVALVLMAALGVQFISGAPPAPEQSAASAVPRGLGRTLVVTSTADSGPGTLRQALLDAQSSDIITFVSTVFPPSAPATIHLTSELPPVSEGNLRIEGNAGVILDGSNITAICKHGLVITSNGNTVRGLQVVNFSCGGISLTNGTQYNTIEGNVTNSNGWGIGLWGDGTSFNTVVGNMVGIDTGDAASGNEGSGVYIFENASYNTIGPDNVIAHNRAFGVKVWDSGSVGNTVTQNSIYDNDRRGIELRDGGNSELAAPCIVDFDLTAGTVTGSTCANCTVEIFSDSSDEGEVYEGQTTADSVGFFTLNKGTAFTGPHLTATATNANGNTSRFSLPTTGTGKSMILQEGNNLPKTKFQPKQSRELEDNRMGDGCHLKLTQSELEVSLEFITGGLKWVRLALDPLSWWGLEDMEDTVEFSKYYIDPNTDKVVTDFANNGITIMYCLAFWDEEIHPVERGYSRFKTEDEIQRYLDYVQFIVHHFKDRIEYYEILNESCFHEDSPFSQQNIELPDYINLVKRTVSIIRQEYPEAKIVAGAAGGMQTLAYRDYFFGTLESSDIMPLVDAVSWHTGGGFLSPEHMAEYYYNYPALVQKIKDVASSHGFKGEYIAEELLWLTSINALPNRPTYTEIVAGKYYARGILMHLGMDVTVGTTGVNPLIPTLYSTVQNLGTAMAGAKPVSLPIEIQSEATNIRSYSFSLPNGDKLIALWTDGVAVDDDPGVRATLTLPGFSAQKVVGIDVLNAIEQQMITDIEDRNLVIRNLLVKDYPIILRLVN